MENEVKTRFAPSPTGTNGMHIGNLRTALYSYLWAKVNNGKFILRIEDTDRQRYSDYALKDIYDVLKSFNMVPDEVYVQSERLSIYEHYAHILIQHNHAYKCYCGKDATDCKCMDGYSGDTNKPYCVKLRVVTTTSYNISCIDELRGEINYSSDCLYDIVLLKEDGYPTYHLASVVDDGLMKITDVFRGDEWLGSFPYHVLLYKYLKFDIPRYYHLSLICNEDGKKLSKRDGDFSVNCLLRSGYIPTSIINYISLLGWHPSGNDEFYTFDDILKIFNVSDISTSPSKFDDKKLRNMNLKHLKCDYGVCEYSKQNKSKYGHRLERVIPIIQDGIDVDNILSMFEGKLSNIVVNDEDVEFFRVIYGSIMRNDVYDFFDGIKYLTMGGIQKIIEDLKDNNYTNKKIHETIRLSITNDVKGLPADRLMSILSLNELLYLVSKHSSLS